MGKAICSISIGPNWHYVRSVYVKFYLAATDSQILYDLIICGFLIMNFIF